MIKYAVVLEQTNYKNGVLYTGKKAEVLKTTGKIAEAEKGLVQAYVKALKLLNIDPNECIPQTYPDGMTVFSGEVNNTEVDFGGHDFRVIGLEKHFEGTIIRFNTEESWTTITGGLAGMRYHTLKELKEHHNGTKNYLNLNKEGSSYEVK